MVRQLESSRFEAVWERNAVSQAAGAGVGDLLLESYNEVGRYYHTCGHIRFCLSVFDQSNFLCADRDAVELAIWFHDAVFNFPIDENERLSAEFFMRMSEAVLPDNLRDTVYRLVMATRHIEPPDDPDEQIIVDIDLSSFGQTWERFTMDGQNVRRELAYLRDAEFYPNQIQFMSKLVSRPYFYNTPWFRERFEQQARDNVSRYIDDLRKKGY